MDLEYLKLVAALLVSVVFIFTIFYLTTRKDF